MYELGLVAVGGSGGVKYPPTEEGYLWAVVCRRVEREREREKERERERDRERGRERKL